MLKTAVFNIWLAFLIIELLEITLSLFNNRRVIPYSPFRCPSVISYLLAPFRAVVMFVTVFFFFFAIVEFFIMWLLSGIEAILTMLDDALRYLECKGVTS